MQGESAGAVGARPWVVKIGGRLVENDAVRAAFAASCAQLAVPLVLVHGGGCVVSDLQKALGSIPQFHEGRRVTSAPEMPMVEMALSGAVNKALVRALQAAGRLAVGVSGCDGAMVRCRLLESLGFVGLPQSVDTSLLRLLMGAGFVPVLSPVSLGPAGEAVNVNADEVAAAVAVALSAQKLLLLSDVPAVRVEGEPQAEIVDDQVERLIAAGEITAGMVPKVQAAALATGRGVDEVRIGGFWQGSLTDVGGTCVRARRVL